MTAALVHFELFTRRRPGASWNLELATEDRALALATAEAALTQGSAAGVRVLKESLDPDTREFRSVTILEKGDLAVVKAKAPPPEVAPLCVEARDLYTVHAREIIGRLLAPWLHRKHVTPFELLHRADLLEALEASGMELQHAIQKIAVPEAQATGASTHDVMRRYQKITDQAIERVIRDARRKAFPTLGRQTFAEVSRRLSTTTDGAYLLGGAVAQHIAPASTWPGKLEALLDLVDPEAINPEATEGRDFTFDVLCQPMAEILGARSALSDISGVAQDLGGDLALMTRLIAPNEVAQLVLINASLQENFPEPTPQIRKLANRLQDPGFLQVRAALARRVLAELNGPRRLRPVDAQGEIVILRALAMVLTLFAGKLAPPEDVQAAFVKRSVALVSADFVEAYVAGAGDVLREMEALIRLGENIVGAANKRSVGRSIAATVGALRFETDLRASPAAPEVKLAALADLQRQLGRIGLPEWDSAYISKKLGEVGGLVEAEARYIGSLSKSPQSRLKSLSALVKLARAESAPKGPVADRAKAEMHRLLRDPAIRTALAGSPDILNAVTEALLEQTAKVS
jgi:pimeloyl-ACP methyl ester carboxylesterase